MLAIVASGVYCLLDQTRFGDFLYALGSNPRAARLVGPRTTLIVAASFVLAGVLSRAGATLNSGLSLAGAPAYVSRYVNGAALIIGVGLAAFVGRRRLRAAGS